MNLVCESLYYSIGDEFECGKPAVAILDASTEGGYPVCEECAAACHPRRIDKIEHCAAVDRIRIYNRQVEQGLIEP